MNCLGKLLLPLLYLAHLLAKPLPEQNPLEEVMHISLFILSDPILLEDAKSTTFKEYYSEDTLHFCEV